MTRQERGKRKHLNKNGNTTVIVAGNNNSLALRFSVTSFAVTGLQELVTIVSAVLDISASAGSRVVVVTANAWSSEQSYVTVVQTNVDLYRGIIPNLAHLSPSAVMLIASQPGR